MQPPIPRLLALLLSLGAATAGAQGSHYARDSWIGIGVARPDYDHPCAGVASGFSGSCADHETTWKLYVGHRLSRHFGMELGYADLGETSAQGSSGADSISSTTRARALSLTGTGHLRPLPRIDLFGRLGVAAWRADNDTFTNGVLSNRNEDGIDPTFGLGGQWLAGEHLGLRAEWERLLDVGESRTTGRSDVDLFSLGLLLRY